MLLTRPLWVSPRRTCDPYAQHGVLLVNPDIAAENRWAPIAAPATCQPVDFVSLLLGLRDVNDDAGGMGTVPPVLEFARNRTIAVLGDSVDRMYVPVEWCFAGPARGRVTLLGVGVRQLIGLFWRARAQACTGFLYPCGREAGARRCGSCAVASLPGRTRTTRGRLYAYLHSFRRPYLLARRPADHD